MWFNYPVYKQKHIQLYVPFWILEFAQMFKETTPQNHPSALRPSHRKKKLRKFQIREKSNKSEKRLLFKLCTRLPEGASS